MLHGEGRPMPRRLHDLDDVAWEFGIDLDAPASARAVRLGDRLASDDDPPVLEYVED